MQALCVALRQNGACIHGFKASCRLASSVMPNRFSSESAQTEDCSRATVMSKRWIQRAVKKRGALHNALGIPQDETIPMSVLHEHEHDPGKLGRRVRLAETLRKIAKRKHKKLHRRAF